MAKILVIFLSLLAVVPVWATETIRLDCDLARIKGEEHRKAKLAMPVPDDGEVVCSSGKGQAIGMEICYAGKIGNVVVRAYDNDGRSFVGGTVSKYGRHDLIPDRFELNTEVPSGRGHEMLIASCSKSKLKFE